MSSPPPASAPKPRFYEGEGLLHAPDRTPGGYRDYPPEVADRLAFIRNAQAAGLSLRQIGEILPVRDGGQAPCRHVAEFVDHRIAEIEQRLHDLRAGHTRSQTLKARVDALVPAVCTPEAICSAVTAD